MVMEELSRVTIAVSEEVLQMVTIITVVAQQVLGGEELLHLGYEGDHLLQLVPGHRGHPRHGEQGQGEQQQARGHPGVRSHYGPQSPSSPCRAPLLTMSASTEGHLSTDTELRAATVTPTPRPCHLIPAPPG